jgi:hypothetical protein
MPAAAHCRRFVRETGEIAPVYGMEVSATEPVVEKAGEAVAGTGAFTVEASGQGWRTTTDVVIYGFDDLMQVYASRSLPVRLCAGMVALGDFIASGTFFRYLKTSPRYAFFFLYPLVVMTSAIGLALALVFVPAAHNLWWSLPAAAAVFAGIIVFAARGGYLLLVMDDWAVARDIARERRPEFGDKFAVVIENVRSRIANADYDEIILAAHSFGAIPAVLSLAAILRGGMEASRFGLLTVGSSLLKIALHPSAGQLREAVETIASRNSPWLEVQSLTDIINFYGSNPVSALGIAEGHGQKTVSIRFRHQLTPETYRAMKLNFFRVHRQFVLAVEKRHAYSFHAVLCGPELFADIVKRGGLAQDWSYADSTGQAANES